ncbi:hypothetical protein [Aquimarina agarilytica]|uniref:hypothetical protein n=1 Tax=Aquimarina agarilytica TaxID=1087449 RepID=UPI00028A1ACF|nr:hypothetical protein [Aquimarina agarilytica]
MKIKIINIGYKILAFGFLQIIFISCKFNEPNTNSFLDWIQDKNISDKIIVHRHHNQCDSVNFLASKLQLAEFKSQHYFSQVNCAESNSEQAKEYLIKMLASGYHITKVDSTEYRHFLEGLNDVYPALRSNFWKDKDTAVFKSIEERFYLDQSSINKARKSKDSLDYAYADSINIYNTKFIIDYIKEKGYPYIPPAYVFSERRSQLSFDILAIHANEKDRAYILESAIQKANQGKISWQAPISICTSFFTNLNTKTHVKPIRFLFFDNNNLEIDKSLLQLYSIVDVYDKNTINLPFFQNKKRKYLISIQPSKSNSYSKEEISKHLEIMKNVLVDKLGMDSNLIHLAQIPDPNEEAPGAIKYDYTLSVLDRKQ